MSYEPRTYWSERARKQGPSYVGPGGDPVRSACEAEAFSAVIERMMPRGRSVLDFGCGSGRLAPALLGRAHEYVGLDACADGVSMAPAIPNARFAWLAGYRIPLLDASIDRAAAIVVFQHIVDDDEAAEWCGEIRRVLAPGGCVLVIDHLEIESPAAHMRTRGPARIRDLLKMEPSNLQILPNHWAEVYYR